jgi:plastocyanin
MIRKVLFAIAALSLVIVAAAGAKSVTVTITKNGYVPSSAKIAQGDVVQFTNSDTVAHQVTFKSTTGVTCSPSVLVIQPGTSGSCTFTKSGSYSYSDPNTKGGTFRGSVVVSASAQSLSIATSTMRVYGAAASPFTGVLSTQAVGENLDVLAQQCSATAATKLTTVQTTAGGAYATTVRPIMNTAYTAKSKSLTSATVHVRVRPSIRLRKVAAHRYALRVSAGSSLAGKYASFQRYNGTLHRWVALRTVHLTAGATGISPTVVSVGSFRSAVHPRLRIRATLPQGQVGSCYAAGTSNTILS